VVVVRSSCRPATIVQCSYSGHVDGSELVIVLCITCIFVSLILQRASLDHVSTVCIAPKKKIFCNYLLNIQLYAIVFCRL